MPQVVVQHCLPHERLHAINMLVKGFSFPQIRNEKGNISNRYYFDHTFRKFYQKSADIRRGG